MNLDWDSITAQRQKMIDDHIVKVNKLVKTGNNLIKHLAHYKMLTSNEITAEKKKEDKLRNEWRLAIENTKED